MFPLGQEPVLLEAGIPIPDDYVPRTKSYTLPSPTEEGHSVQILCEAQLPQCIKCPYSFNLQVGIRCGKKLVLYKYIFIYLYVNIIIHI